MKRIKFNLCLIVLAAIFFIPLSSCDLLPESDSETQGVTNDEILIGSHTALSGMAAYWGVGISNAIQLVFDEVNSRGGIHGRKIRFIVEDTRYNVSMAERKAIKLIKEDKVFIMIGALGTQHNNAVFPLQFSKNVPNVFPASYARSMIQPYNKLKFTLAPTYYDQMRAAVKFFVEKRHRKSICVLHQNNDFGKEILDGVNDQLKAMGMETTVAISHMPSAISFKESIQELRNAKCDAIAMGTIVRDTIGIVRTARKMGWKVDMVGNTASCSDIVIKMGGPPMEGFFSAIGLDVAEKDMVFGEAKKFFEAYKKRYGKYPDQSAVNGYNAGKLTVRALENAGRRLSVSRFIKGMEDIKSYNSPFNGPKRSFGLNKHQGTNQSQLVYVKNGKWVSPIGKTLILKY